MPFRTKDRPFQRKRLRATCIVIVEAPREGPSGLSITVCSCCQSTPWCRQNCPSSDITTASTRLRENPESGVHCRSTARPETHRPAIRVETAGRVLS